jgi:secreted trypsin-like serine protease
MLVLAHGRAIALDAKGDAAGKVHKRAESVANHSGVMGKQMALRDADHLDDVQVEEGGRRIVGGVLASKFKWAALMSQMGGKPTTCTLEIIADRWMLTAAHCILNDNSDGYAEAGPGKTTILYGCLSITDETKCKVADAKRYVPHPCYTPSLEQDHDDIALIELTEPVEPFGGDMALVNGLNGSVDLPEGSNVFISGFGAMQPDGSDIRSSRLLEVQVKTATKNLCVAANPDSSSNNFINFDHVVCTGGEEGKDSCNGDSGGPAMLNKDGERWVVGVLSKGSQLPDDTPNCAVDGRYSLYTLVDKYGSWIYDTIHGKDFVCDTCPCVGVAPEFVRSDGKMSAFVHILLLFDINADELSTGLKYQNIKKAFATASGAPEEIITLTTVAVRRGLRRGTERRVQTSMVTVQFEFATADQATELRNSLTVEDVRRELELVGLKANTIQILDEGSNLDDATTQLINKGIPPQN